MFVDLQSLNTTQVISAIGALGTAAFGLVQALKPAFPWINRIGFSGVRKMVCRLTPPEAGAINPANALPQKGILRSLDANWVNGTDLASQKAIAKSLIKLHMSEGNAAALAEATNVDAGLLTAVAASMATGTALTQAQSDANSRFDLIMTAMLDECYQRADQQYRNWMRGLAAAVAVVLVLAAGCILHANEVAAHPDAVVSGFWWSREMAACLIVGLLATPLAPIVKDLTNALGAAVNAMQVVKKS